MKKWLIAFIVVLACAGAAIVVAIRSTTSPLTYHGGTVKVWALQLYAYGQAHDDAAAALTALGEQGVPDLIRLLQSSDPPFKRQVRAAVPSLPSVIRPAVLSIYGKPSGAEVRIAGARGLALLGPKAVSAADALEAAMRGKDHAAANEAAVALAQVSPDCVRRFQSALRERNVNARRAGAYALGGLGDRAFAAVPDLLAALTDPDKWVRDSADGSLWRVGAAAVPGVLEYVTRERGPERERLAGQLANLYSCPPSKTPPIATLGFDTPDLQQARVRALRKVPPGAADITLGRVLAAIANDPASPVRVAALVALNGVNTPTVILALMHRLQDPDAAVRAEAARTLGSLGEASRPAVFRLRRLEADEQEPVRLAAAEALARIER